MDLPYSSSKTQKYKIPIYYAHSLPKPDHVDFLDYTISMYDNLFRI